MRRALANADHASVIALTERAIAAGVSDPTLFSALGHAHLFCGNRPAALAALESSLALDPGQFHLWLKQGQLHETEGNQYRALTTYFRAITDAQQQGRWTNDTTTQPALREAVKHAVAFIDDGRRRLFRAALEPLRRAHSAAAVARIERCIDAYLGGMRGPFDHPMQRPTYLFVPSLSSASFYPRELFPWMDELEANADAIREEALAVLAGGNSLLEPFLGEGSDGVATGQLRNDRGEAKWDAFFFYRHGRRYDENHARCPITSAVLEKLPMVRIEEHAPEILFSVLTPGSHILPHTGVTNARLTSHLALLVPPGCAIRVGEETREWEEGRGFVFDDTHEHEAWNHGDQTRVVLIVDVWNPNLTAIEREAFGTLVQTMLSFSRACGFKSIEERLEEHKLQKTTPA
ncbi:MAG TPA: aspartyl/asparaginyl beta-hydroxylase domain-containing protein [Xanthomonadaceae bacterium]|nr:aspartyl/asparaginyl beta-hydroxylase domain-containing protein [Xanthomonadaceae bacterium]